MWKAVAMTAPAQRKPRHKPPFPPRVNVRVLREIQAISVSELRDRICENGYVLNDDSTIRNIELGHQFIRAPLRAAWAKALGIRPADLIAPENGNGHGEDEAVA
jgi:hypothetical protein